MTRGGITKPLPRRSAHRFLSAIQAFRHQASDFTPIDFRCYLVTFGMQKRHYPTAEPSSGSPAKTWRKASSDIGSRPAEGESNKERVEGAEEAPAASEKKFGKTIIMPVAIPGVGKTTIAVALAELFQFGHTQSDDVRAKRRGPAFIQNVTKLLRSHDVVIADKNNHLRMHRRALRDAVKGMHPPVRLLALYWSLDRPHAETHRICASRILARGTNHQTLRADGKGKAHEGVLWQFLHTTEPLADDEADIVIEMDVREDFEHALARAVDAVVRVLGLPRPDAEHVGAALARARG
ncbi:tRNA ligase kinase domain-containing protein [Lactarius psammicola]|nr:tRNA ligase kinase domain-containing protein [Lactarius psammicola]